MNTAIAMAILAFFSEGCFSRGFRTIYRSAPTDAPKVGAFGGISPSIPGQCDGTYGCPMKMGDPGLNIDGSYVDVLNYVDISRPSAITSTRRLITRDVDATVEIPATATTTATDTAAPTPVASPAPSQAPEAAEIAPEDVVLEAYRKTVYNEDGELVHKPLPHAYDRGSMELWSQRNFHGHRTRLGRRPGVCDTVEAYVSSRVGFGRSARVLEDDTCCQLFTNRGCTGHSMMMAEDVPSLGPYGMDSRIKSVRCNLCTEMFKGTVEMGPYDEEPEEEETVEEVVAEKTEEKTEEKAEKPAEEKPTEEKTSE